MALRCSLTGHDWGDTRTDVDREEGLDEVAIAEVEYRECERCGEVDVISENTEVTAMRGADDAEATDGPDEGTDEQRETSRHVETDDDAVIIDADDPAPADGDAAEEETDEKPAYIGMESGGSTSAAQIQAGSYRCPECGFQEDAAASSHRPGDLCPRCPSGYLEERD